MNLSSEMTLIGQKWLYTKKNFLIECVNAKSAIIHGCQKLTKNPRGV